MRTRSRLTLLVLLAALSLAPAAATVAQSPSPAPASDGSPAPSPAASPGPSDRPALPWPSGDELRADLQTIGFLFRIEGTSGDWLAWPPASPIEQPPAMRLGGAGTLGAIASFDFALLSDDPMTLLLGGDLGPTLTALYETTSRLPIAPSDIELARRFLIEDLLAEPPELLEPCYTSDWERGAALVTLEVETGAASLHLAPTIDDIPAAAGLEPDSCSPLLPTQVIEALDDIVTERHTIAVTDGDEPRFDPAEISVAGSLVTLILTLRNETEVEQTLTFAPPLSSDTGPVPPGEIRLIVVRELVPGEYAFHSASDPAGLAGVIRIEAPPAE